MEHQLLKVFLGSSKGLYIERSSRMRSKRRKELAIIVAPKAILQENVTGKIRFKEKIQRFFTNNHNK
jgi:hypothetical protein